MEQNLAGHITLAVRALQQATAEAQRALARRLELGLSDVAALDHLVRSRTPLGPVELGELLGIRSASATVLVDRLVEAGHVVRTNHPSDRRRRVLYTTEQARAEVLRAVQPLIDALQELAAGLDDEQAHTVLLFLQRAADVHAAYARDCERQ